MSLHIVFINFSKAFNTVDQPTFWKILQKLGVLNHFTNLINALHTSMKASIKLKGASSDLFQVKNGVKQGCVLAPSLLSIFLSVVLQYNFENCDNGHWIQSRPRADMLNVDQYKSATKTRKILVEKLMFAYDTAFVAHIHDGVQKRVSRFARFIKAFGLG
ncbi:uncharacterized protein [Watersipora subatra]|uniref:uncharacterized protein n=1 Tax=Watersipora subatra TaxID=2589382 RepID=UPI00355B801B